LNEDLVFLELNAATAEGVLRGLLIDEWNAPENSRYIQSVMHWKAVNGNQLIAEVDLRLVTGATRAYMNGKNPIRPTRLASISPGDAVIGNLELTQLLEVNDGRYDRCDAQHQQQRIRELASQLAHRTSGLPKCWATSPFSFGQ
jgi:hypothetical protein